MRVETLEYEYKQKNANRNSRILVETLEYE